MCMWVHLFAYVPHRVAAVLWLLLYDSIAPFVLHTHSHISCFLSFANFCCNFDVLWQPYIHTHIHASRCSLCYCHNLLYAWETRSIAASNCGKTANTRVHISCLAAAMMHVAATEKSAKSFDSFSADLQAIFCYLRLFLWHLQLHGVWCVYVC